MPLPSVPATIYLFLGGDKNLQHGLQIWCLDNLVLLNQNQVAALEFGPLDEIINAKKYLFC